MQKKHRELTNVSYDPVDEEILGVLADLRKSCNRAICVIYIAPPDGHSQPIPSDLDLFVGDIEGEFEEVVDRSGEMEWRGMQVSVA